ncbi:MAG: aminotransferase class V-fold PLP-dependent enzyme [Acidimicrobiales bacterium]|nr:aminotransferase class V-fold PLP-dependent enzyme [Acidimicrobiales bacterium]
MDLAMERPTPPLHASRWGLNPEITFLNHGSFGACPHEVLAAQEELRRRLEAQPVDFLTRQAPGLIDEARNTLADFLGADPAGLVFVPNATTGVNAVLASYPFTAGDEVIITNHTYNACANAARYWAERAGASVKVASVPFPISNPAEVVESIVAEIGPRTVLGLIDHVTSETALVFPIEQIADALHARGVEVLVDGAHAPGMVPLDLETLTAAYYTGNCHKWLCAPKGAAFLSVRSDRRSQVRPVVISHGANAPLDERSRFHQEFDWAGTADPTPWLCVPEALRVMGSIADGGWPGLMAANHELVLNGRRMLVDALGIPEPAPPAMIGSIATVPLPAGPGRPPGAFATDPLQDHLWSDHRIEVPVLAWSGAPHRQVRISAQCYNQPADYEALAAALVAWHTPG